jgi:hypothetical protein
MGTVSRPVRVRRLRLGPFALGVFLVLLGFWYARGLLHDTWALASLPLTWPRHSDRFYISAEHDDFDVTFANYSIHQTSAAPFPDKIPAVLHHISLGSGASTHSKWAEVRQSCLDMHPDWEAFLWTDETANELVIQNFPEFYNMWMSYRYPIEKVDALRYMILYHYGGKRCPLLPWRWHRETN